MSCRRYIDQGDAPMLWKITCSTFISVVLSASPACRLRCCYLFVRSKCDRRKRVCPVWATVGSIRTQQTDVVQNVGNRARIVSSCHYRLSLCCQGLPTESSLLSNNVFLLESMIESTNASLPAMHHLQSLVGCLRAQACSWPYIQTSTPPRSFQAIGNHFKLCRLHPR